MSNAWEAPGLSPEERAAAVERYCPAWPAGNEAKAYREALTAAAADARRGAIEEAAGVLDARAKTCAKHGSNHPAGSADRREWAMAAGSLAAAEADIRNLPGAGKGEG